MRLPRVSYPLAVWAVVIPLWAVVLLGTLRVYDTRAAPSLLGLVLAATAALLVRWIRWTAMVVPALDLLLQPPTSTLAVLSGAAVVVAAAVVLALLDGWDLAEPGRSYAPTARPAPGPWVAQRLHGLLMPLTLVIAAALGWSLVAGVHLGGNAAWLVALTPGALLVATAAATSWLWWRPRRDSNPRPPP